MKVNIGVSNRHVHLTKKDLETLFGEGYVLTKKADLKQTGQYACNETVTIKTEKNEFQNVRIIGPTRNYTQVEVSASDSYFLGIKPPVRDSGDLENSETVKIIGPKGTVDATNSTIISIRHIHMSTEDLRKYNVKDKQFVNVLVDGIKGCILKNVLIKGDDSFVLEMHIDLDEANAMLLSNGSTVEMLLEDTNGRH